MKWLKENSEVLYPEKDGVLGIAKSDIEHITKIALRNERERARYCTHASINDAVHEMFIYHKKGAYIRPHKHNGKEESFHLIEGELTTLIFDEEGDIKHMLNLGSYETGKMFYYRVPKSVFHTQIFHQDTVFHETTRGPFNKKDSEFAVWSPEETDTINVAKYIDQLEVKIKAVYCTSTETINYR